MSVSLGACLVGILPLRWIYGTPAIKFQLLVSYRSRPVRWVYGRVYCRDIQDINIEVIGKPSGWRAVRRVHYCFYSNV